MSRKVQQSKTDNQRRTDQVSRPGQQLRFNDLAGWEPVPAQRSAASPRRLKMLYLDGYHTLMDAAKALDATATAQHPEENHYYYSTLLNLVYKELFGVSKGSTRGLRQRLTLRQVQKLARVEREVAGWILDILSRGADYHAVYYQVQQQLQQRVIEVGRETLAPPKAAPVQQTLW